MKPVAPAKLQITPAALMLAIKLNLVHRPLWHVETVTDCLGLSRVEIMHRVENGTFPFAFDVGNSRRKTETRILALSVVEQQLGSIPQIEATRNLQLLQVIDLILPKRDLRSTDLHPAFAGRQLRLVKGIPAKIGNRQNHPSNPPGQTAITWSGGGSAYVESNDGS